MTRGEVAGWLLVASFALWLPVAMLPARIWSASLPERLVLVSERQRRWQVANLSIAGAAVLLVLGFVALAQPLEQAGAGVVVPLCLAVLVVGAPLWLASLAFRVTAMGIAPGGDPPAGFRTLAVWAGGLFLFWSVLANLAVVGFGAAIVQSEYPAAWCGWTAIGLGGLMLVQLLVTGDALPALYHVGPLLVGVALLVG